MRLKGKWYFKCARRVTAVRESGGGDRGRSERDTVGKRSSRATPVLAPSRVPVSALVRGHVNPSASTFQSLLIGSETFSLVVERPPSQTGVPIVIIYNDL
jgi:hypothetical protein